MGAEALRMKAVFKALIVLVFAALYPIVLAASIFGFAFEAAVLGFKHGRLKFYTMFEILKTF